MNASSLHEGVEGIYVSTRYPYFLNYMLKIMGNNRYLAQYINIIFGIIELAGHGWKVLNYENFVFYNVNE